MSQNDFITSGGNSLHLSKIASSLAQDSRRYVAEQVAVPLSQSGIINYSFLKNQAGWSDLSSTIVSQGPTPCATLAGEDETLVQGSLDTHGVRAWVSEREILLRGQSGVSRDQVIKSQLNRVVGSLMVNRDYELAKMLTTSGNYNASNVATVSTKWDAAGSDPVADILAAVGQLAKGPAKSENYLVADESVFIALMGNAAVRNAVGGISYAPSLQNLEQILGVHIVVSRATWGNTNSMFGNYAVLYRRPVNADVNDDGAMECSFRLIHNADLPITVRTYTPDELEGQGVYVEAKSTYKFISPYSDANGKFNTAFLLAAPLT